MLIRDASTADWPAIWPFLHKIVVAGDTFTYDPELREEEAEAMWMARPPGRVVVAEADGGNVVGTASMYANRAGPGAHIASASYMVDPSHQGTGVGRALVSDSLRWARARGFQGMQFNAVAQTNSYAIRLYESLGFTVIGTIPGGFRHPVAGDVGLHIMFCPL
ncbi:GNAT family N-acetyltransferase [Paramicrobacterium chengjingii]|uniref:GNAT family N-acetyltransferase n=1 Tax=Paramicrobacterium chengjingii TaxID=2769067 RepID=A0ABX6YKZ0_9MICO|nr:GNAT family N-acetyltransferase [Microbacterium chengjingii]QPZ39002.1 GNAT family N-acetyltransferase [Microbacterium chengjingii]